MVQMQSVYSITSAAWVDFSLEGEIQSVEKKTLRSAAAESKTMNIINDKECDLVIIWEKLNTNKSESVSEVLRQTYWIVTSLNMSSNPGCAITFTLGPI